MKIFQRVALYFSLRGAKDAIKKSESYINECYKWIVDIDLEKFFDKVNPDILMYKLSKDIKYKRDFETNKKISTIRNND